jgi:hydroxylamine reductase
MFCFQCEQTAGCTGCRGNAGVCGKKSDTADMQDALTGALIGLARLAGSETVPADSTSRVLIEGLFTTVTNVSFDDDAIRVQLERAHAEKARILQNSASGKDSSDYSMKDLWDAREDIRSLKSLILFGLRGMSAYASHARVLGYHDDDVDRFFCEGLAAVGGELTMEQLLPVVLKVGEVNLKCMALLDRANTETYGTPVPVTVPLKVEKGPFIVVTGHDLRDLKLLLEQIGDRGVHVYTHGEMLPAQAYPELKKYPQLRGNFGTAWQNQQREFDGIPAPVLYTTNCLMPPKASYADRVFTTGEVAFPGTVHIGEDKDFTPVIEKALALGGYSEDRQFTGINGGTEVTTGFGRETVLSHAGDIAEAVKAGKISHFFLVAGCDGAKPGRNYYTEFVKQTPKDSIVLTLACGKYRFNDLDLGTVAGLPRILDMGQCNDAYGAIQVAVALAQAFDCGVNDLPLSFVLSWYEQKAVCILLTLLHLGIQNILLGPTLPAFLSPNVLKYLVDNYHIGPVSTPEKDLDRLLGRKPVSGDGVAAQEESRAAMLKGYVGRLSRGDSLDAVRKDFVSHFRSVDAAEIARAEQELIMDGTPVADVQKLCDVHSALFHGATREEQIANAEKAVEASSAKADSMPAAASSAPDPGHPVSVFTAENKVLSALIKGIRDSAASGESRETAPEKLEELRAALAEHYAAKGDLVYPLLKAGYGISGPADVMWGVDDEIRDELKVLAGEGEALPQYGERLEKVLTRAEEMVYKEANILYPLCLRFFTKEDWMRMYDELPAYDYEGFAKRPVWSEAEEMRKEAKSVAAESAVPAAGEEGTIRLGSGHMTPSQVEAVLNTIPMELSFIDDKDKNCFFNAGKKLFRRPDTAVDREVYSCHPPKFAAMARQVIASLRSGAQDSVDVWMNKRGEPVLVRYMAVRNEKGEYVGTLECVQKMGFAKKHFNKDGI